MLYFSTLCTSGTLSFFDIDFYEQKFTNRKRLRVQRAYYHVARFELFDRQISMLGAEPVVDHESFST